MTDNDREWEVVYTLRTRVHAPTATDALGHARPKLNRGDAEMTDVRVFLYTEQHRLASLIEVLPERTPRPKNSPIEVLRRKAQEKCTWCWHNFWCAKDPKDGWVHIDKAEYQARGKLAIHKCAAPEVSDQMLELEEAELR